MRQSLTGRAGRGQHVGRRRGQVRHEGVSSRAYGWRLSVAGEMAASATGGRVAEQPEEHAFGAHQAAAAPISLLEDRRVPRRPALRLSLAPITRSKAAAGLAAAAAAQLSKERARGRKQKREGIKNGRGDQRGRADIQP
jgi:hypothetical protein